MVGKAAHFANVERGLFSFGARLDRQNLARYQGEAVHLTGFSVRQHAGNRCAQFIQAM